MEGQQGSRSGRATGLAAAVLLMTGCGTGPEGDQGQEASEIDVDGAETQSEQIDEIAYGVGKLSEHFEERRVDFPAVGEGEDES